MDKGPWKCEIDANMLSDHVKSESHCGCKCGAIDSNNTDDKTFHSPRHATYSCLCACERIHDGEWISCGTAKICSLVADHTENGGTHQFAAGYKDDAVHKCKCGKTTAEHVKERIQTGVEPGYLVFQVSCNVAGCGYSKTEKESCAHDWGDGVLLKVEGSVAYYLFTCKICKDTKVDTMEGISQEKCNPEKNIHVASKDENSCGCECGKYGASEKSSSDSLHKWKSDVRNSAGVANCQCICGERHVFRKGGDCPEACAYCFALTKTGGKATEEYHVIKDATEHSCGCRCGYYGISTAHQNSGRYADTYRLHVRCTTAQDGSPAYCQCYGSGEGGDWHWCESQTTCENVCKYSRTQDKLGHLVSKGSGGKPVYGITKATASDHTAGEYGCGCKCGKCDKSNSSLWNSEKSLHKPARNSTDRCHCECANCLVGSADGHEYESGKCTCTCGERHKSEFIGVCGLCSGCGNYFKDGEKVDAETAKHEFDEEGSCTCKCSAKVKNPESTKHKFIEGQCKCECGEKHTLNGDLFTGPCGKCVQCGMVLHLDMTVKNEPRPQGEHDFTDADGATKCVCRCKMYHNDGNLGECNKCSGCGLFKHPGTGEMVEDISDDLHEFYPQTGFNCSCKCREIHRLKGSPACGICLYCYMIDDGTGELKDASDSKNHKYPTGQCRCECGANIRSIGHVFEANSCRCNCLDTTRPHNLDDIILSTSVSSCWDCGAKFSTEVVEQICTRCQEVIDGAKSITTGEHMPECGQPKTTDICYYCGCHCKGVDIHFACGVHVCNFCCFRVAPVEPNPDDPESQEICSNCGMIGGSHEVWCSQFIGCTWCGAINGHYKGCKHYNPEDPEPDGPKPKPPISESCTHDWKPDTWNMIERCGVCGNNRTTSGSREVCTICGAVQNQTSTSTGCSCVSDPDGPESETCEICGGYVHDPSCPYFTGCQECGSNDGHNDFCSQYEPPSGGGHSGGGNLWDI